MSAALVGIARLAAASPLLDAKRRVQYFSLESRHYIGRVSGRRMPFDWTVNPYRGCEFGCKYCYARYTHEFMELRDTQQFEQQIYAKSFRPEVFRSELRRIPRQEGICIGTATDPYQPAERRYRITQHMLEVLARERGRTLSLTTKSDLVARDAGIAGAGWRPEQPARLHDCDHHRRSPGAAARALRAAARSALRGDAKSHWRGRARRGPGLPRHAAC